ncbi:serine/threonine-protein kinase [Homoserinibacter gongjuensis]|uniref:non-specific serine/threonine protein kinase n=1 Tax=Homoserinibacter gongjuensis TaxID=1162968 RepID=A0ABQ6JWU5_9MICO|nr:serine/threonine-protein kinase [Homoserinibacter gongjuensis]GMA92182.1 hypothetical protein GCM10025869_27110 [Homoserinibacter gongjuensis]
MLPGFSYVHVLGSGGFADVFLYEQNMPRRQVAVKVMLSEVVNDQVRQMFQAEANLMAQLSAHPSILTVYQASVSSDGRPYLVMELCSASLSERYRREPIPVPEVLRIAIKIGSAIETAHRAGVLHRDIKPSNILQTAYGHPVLSDFGIASTLGSQKDENSVGLSIPWSAPEVLLDETPGSIASEVWSLAATTYSLLAGRSPFEVPGGANTSSDLMGRIARAKPQPIGRPDVPASLEAVLRKAMSRRPEQRPASALELVRELQLVEAELGLPQTAAEIAMDDWALGTVADQEERTRLRPVSTGSSPSPVGRRRRRRAARPDAYAPVGTVRDRSGPDTPSRTAPPRSPRRASAASPGCSPPQPGSLPCSASSRSSCCCAPWGTASPWSPTSAPTSEIRAGSSSAGPTPASRTMIGTSSRSPRTASRRCRRCRPRRASWSTPIPATQCVCRSWSIATARRVRPAPRSAST